MESVDCSVHLLYHHYSSCLQHVIYVLCCGTLWTKTEVTAIWWDKHGMDRGRYRNHKLSKCFENICAVDAILTFHLLLLYFFKTNKASNCYIVHATQATSNHQSHSLYFANAELENVKWMVSCKQMMHWTNSWVCEHFQFQHRSDAAWWQSHL